MPPAEVAGPWGGWLTLLFCLAAALGALVCQGAGAATFTPLVAAKLGYSDNVRFSETPRSSGFLAVEPGFRFQAGKPSSRFTADGMLTYSYYFDIPEYTRFESARASASYTKEFSQVWRLTLRDVFISTFDAPIEDRQGNLVRLKTVDGRRDSNTISGETRYEYGQKRFIHGGYAYTTIRYSEDEESDADIQHVWAGDSHQWGPKWRTDLDASYTHTDYKTSDPVERSSLKGVLTRFVGPTLELYAGAGFRRAESRSSSSTVRDARSYDTYDFMAGITHRVTPRFSYGLGAGWSSVQGDSEGNSAAGEGFPTLDAWVKYLGRTWNIYLAARSSLDEDDLVGDNTGLTRSQSIMLAYNYHYTRHLSFSLTGSIVQNDYKQDPEVAGTDPVNTGDVYYYRATAGAQYALTKDLTLSLTYRYLEADSEVSGRSRHENRVYLMLGWQYPLRW